MVEFSVAWCGSEAGTTWLQRGSQVSRVRGGGGRRVSFTAKLLSSSCYQNKPPKTRQMMIRHLHTAQVTAGNEKYTKYHFPFPVQDIEQRNIVPLEHPSLFAHQFLLYLTFSFFLYFCLLPLLLMSLQKKILQFTYIYCISPSQVYSLVDFLQSAAGGFPSFPTRISIQFT
jgi:hypothetical protein